MARVVTLGLRKDESVLRHVLLNLSQIDTLSELGRGRYSGDRGPEQGIRGDVATQGSWFASNPKVLHRAGFLGPPLVGRWAGQLCLGDLKEFNEKELQFQTKEW